MTPYFLDQWFEPFVLMFLIVLLGLAFHEAYRQGGDAYRKERGDD